VTPRRQDGNQADLGATLDLVDFVCRKGVDGIVILGSTGEFVHFDIEDRLRLAQFAIKRSKAPVTVNVSHSSLDGALILAREACSQGASALLVMPPYFFPYSQADIEEFYLRFARELGGGVPLLLYNVPSFTSEIRCDTAMRLLATGLFAGIKDSSGRMDKFRRMQAAKRQAPFTLLIGADKVFAQARAEGADGVISGAAGAVPELLLGLEGAIRAGAAGKRDRLEARLEEFIAWTERFAFPAGLKEAVALRGLKTGPPALPAGRETQALLGEFREWFQGWLPAVLTEAAGAGAVETR
jgi:dihydrodipicolinate synthase/N-acetylneuraminate lyase